jgi:hypothetical protein
MNFKFEIFNEDKMLIDIDNVDVKIILENGDTFFLTFFTIANIQVLLKRYNETGECAFGTYFWASNMVIVNSLNIENIKKTIEQLIKDNELKMIGQKV